MSRSTDWKTDIRPFTRSGLGTDNRKDDLLYSPVETPSVNLPSTTKTLPVSDWDINWKSNWDNLEKDFLTTPVDQVNASTGTGVTPPPPPEGGLAKWFAKEGNMNMLGAAATGINVLAGLAGTRSALDTASKQRKLLKQQLAHNRTVMNNRKQLINQLKGSY